MLFILIFCFVCPIFTQILQINETFQTQDVYLYRSPETIESGITIIKPGENICSFSFFSTFTKNVMAFCSNSSFLETIEVYYLNGGYIEFSYTVLKVSSSEDITDYHLNFYYMADNERKYTKVYIEKIVNRDSTFNTLRYDFKNKEIKFKIQPKFNLSDAVLIINEIKIYKNNDDWIFNSYTLFYEEKYIVERASSLEVDVANATDSICSAYSTNSSEDTVCPNLKNYQGGGFNSFCFRNSYDLSNTYSYKYVPPYALIVFNLTFCDLDTDYLPDLDLSFGFLLKSGSISSLKYSFPKNFTPSYSFSKTPYWKTIHLYINQNYWTSLIVYAKAQNKYHKNLLINDFKIYFNTNKSISHSNSSCYSKNISKSGSSSFVPECSVLMNTKSPCIPGLDYILSSFNVVKNEFGPVIFSPEWTNSYSLYGYTIPSNIEAVYVNKTTMTSNSQVFFDSFDEIEDDFSTSLGVNLKFSKDPKNNKTSSNSKNSAKSKKGSFSLDIDFQKQFNKFKYEFMSTATNRYIKEEFLLNIYPILDSDFYNDILKLPTTKNKFEYMKFILKYGTHYINNITLGGIIKSSSSVHYCEIESQSSKNLYIKNFLDVSKSFLDVSIEDSYYSLRKEFYENKHFTVEVDGGFSQLFCCDNCDLDKWSQTVKYNPTVVSMDLYEISTLIEDETIKSNLEEVIEDYMKKSQGMVESNRKNITC